MSEFENENLWVVMIDREKHLLSVGNDTTDLTKQSIQQIGLEGQSVWDDV